MKVHTHQSPAFPLWMVLLTAQAVASFVLWNQAGNTALQIAGWATGVIAGVLGVWPIIALRRKGRVSPGKGYTHTTVLVDTGIYAVVRHPQYLSFMLLSLFLAFIAQHWLSIVLGAAAVVVAYAGIIPQADRANLEKFGEAYERYMNEVPGVNLLAGIVRCLRRR